MPWSRQYGGLQEIAVEFVVTPAKVTNGNAEPGVQY